MFTLLPAQNIEATTKEKLNKTKTGVKTYSCMFCEVELEREELPKSDHSYYWDGSDMMRTHMCSNCDYVGITEYNIGGACGCYDDEAAALILLFSEFVKMVL